ncbi:hypothetical protein GAY28_11570 [Azospirillum brasilense]|nr:hypothetical protein [Azospirillum brasilense]
MDVPSPPCFRANFVCADAPGGPLVRRKRGEGGVWGCRVFRTFGGCGAPSPQPRSLSAIPGPPGPY